MAGKLLLESTESKLTIVVPVHNMQERMSHLRSWLAQAEELRVKVILVHDKSDDSTNIELEEIIQSQTGGNISVLEVAVKSPGLARNAGLEKIQTRWFSFADADDFVNVPGLISLLENLEFSGCDLGIGAYSSIDLKCGSERIQTPPTQNNKALALHLAQTMGLWRFIFLSERYKDLRFTSHRMGEDFVFANQALNIAHRIETSSQVVYRYFYGGKLNLTSNKFVMSDMLGIIEIIKKLDSQSEIGKVFRKFALQKLSISVLKNLSLKHAITKKILLLSNLISHPTYLLNFTYSMIRNRKRSHNE